MHAPEKIHRLLEPEGILINILPLDRPKHMEYHHSGSVIEVGDTLHRLNFENYKQALAAEAETIERGLFSEERKLTFDFYYYFKRYADFAEWMDDTSGPIPIWRMKSFKNS